ncbi:ATP-binding protein [Yinghuangia aomiensis]
MVRVGSPPESPRPPSAAPLWLLPVAVSVLASAAAVALVDKDVRLPLGIGLGVAVVAIAFVAAEAVRRGRRLALEREYHRQQERALHERIATQEEALHHLTRELLPKNHHAAAERRQRRRSPDGRHHRSRRIAGVLLRAGPGPADGRRRGRGGVKGCATPRSARSSTSPAVCRRSSTSRRPTCGKWKTGTATGPTCSGTSLKLDHGTALIGRLADSIAVLGGARPGRQWQKDVPLYSVLRGAVSRIADYPRVEILSVTEVAVVGPAVEPLIHALAELLDNATRYSPPKTKVRVTASEVQSGVAVEIEDGGIGLAEEAPPARRAPPGGRVR